MSEFVQSIGELAGAREDWRPMSRWAVSEWLIFICFS
jgi:hypothetical protein